MGDEHERIVDFLCGSGPDAKGLWFDEVAAREKGRPFWWRRYVRQAERAHAARIEELEAERDEDQGVIRVWRRRTEEAETALAAERKKVARLVEALGVIVDSYDARSELYITDADCAGNLADRARAALASVQAQEGEG